MQQSLVSKCLVSALLLKNLPEAYSSPFICYFAGYKYHEIAQEMDLPLGTLERRIHEARK